MVNELMVVSAGLFDETFQSPKEMIRGADRGNGECRI